MLTWEEFCGAMSDASRMEADEFVRYTSDYFPESALDLFMTELMEGFIRRGTSAEEALKYTAAIMGGFQMGWFVHKACGQA